MRYEYVEGISSACKNVLAGLEEIEAMVRRMEAVADEAHASRCFSTQEMRTFEMVAEIASTMKRNLCQDSENIQHVLSKIRNIDS